MQGAFRDKLQVEFAARRARNARYSLRSFAAFLEADHSTVAQILRGSRPVPPARIRAWAKKLGLGSEEAAVYVAAEHVAPPSPRTSQLQHWTAEALAVIGEPAHLQILQCTRDPAFQPDTRWVASTAGLSADQVNLALTRLLRLGLLEMSQQVWRDCTGLEPLTEKEFRRVALDRVRQAAAEHGVKFGKSERKKKV